MTSPLYCASLNGSILVFAQGNIITELNLDTSYSKKFLTNSDQKVSAISNANGFTTVCALNEIRQYENSVFKCSAQISGLPVFTDGLQAICSNSKIFNADWTELPQLYKGNAFSGDGTESEIFIGTSSDCFIRVNRHSLSTQQIRADEYPVQYIKQFGAQTVICCGKTVQIFNQFSICTHTIKTQARPWAATPRAIGTDVGELIILSNQFQPKKSLKMFTAPIRAVFDHRDKIIVCQSNGAVLAINDADCQIVVTDAENVFQKRSELRVGDYQFTKNGQILKNEVQIMKIDQALAIADAAIIDGQVVAIHKNGSVSCSRHLFHQCCLGLSQRALIYKQVVLDQDIATKIISIYKILTVASQPHIIKINQVYVDFDLVNVQVNGDVIQSRHQNLQIVIPDTVQLIVAPNVQQKEYNDACEVNGMICCVSESQCLELFNNKQLVYQMHFPTPLRSVCALDNNSIIIGGSQNLLALLRFEMSENSINAVALKYSAYQREKANYKFTSLLAINNQLVLASDSTGWIHLFHVDTTFTKIFQCEIVQVLFRMILLEDRKIILAGTQSVLLLELNFAEINNISNRIAGNDIYISLKQIIKEQMDVAIKYDLKNLYVTQSLILEEHLGSCNDADTCNGILWFGFDSGFLLRMKLDNLKEKATERFYISNSGIACIKASDDYCNTFGWDRILRKTPPVNSQKSFGLYQPHRLLQIGKQTVIIGHGIIIIDK